MMPELAGNIHWSYLGADLIRAAWADVWPLIQLAVRRTGRRHSEAAVLDSIIDNSFQCWVAGDRDHAVQLAVVTEIIEYPRQRWCRIVFCGGKGIDSYLPFLDILEDWAKINGCSGVEMIGRPGWAGKLPDSYRQGSRVFEKEFTA